jgi:hypothetical protein
MNEWKMIGQGFIVAAMGAASSMLFIVAASAAYMGKFTIGAASIIVASSLAIAFRSCLRPFLDALDRREAEFTSHVGAQRREDAASTRNLR